MTCLPVIKSFRIQPWISEGSTLVVVRLLSIDANRRGRREDEQERKGQEGRSLPGKWDSRQKVIMKIVQNGIFPDSASLLVILL